MIGIDVTRYQTVGTYQHRTYPWLRVRVWRDNSKPRYIAEPYWTSWTREVPVRDRQKVLAEMTAIQRASVSTLAYKLRNEYSLLSPG